MHYTICELIADLTQNAIEADAKVISIRVHETETELCFEIQDNGKGMDSETLKKVRNPFYTDGIKHPNRKVGLGIPFLIQTANQTDGTWHIDSQKGKGTKLKAVFSLSNIDTPPLGCLTSLFRQILSFPQNYEMNIERIKETKNDSKNYSISRSELIEALGELETVESLDMLRTFLESHEE
jgi:hypothetical protein